MGLIVRGWSRLLGELLFWQLVLSSGIIVVVLIGVAIKEVLG